MASDERSKLKSALSRIPSEKIPDEYLAQEFSELQADPSVAEFFGVALRVYGIQYGIILRIAASPAGSTLLSAAFMAAGLPIPPGVLAAIGAAGLDAQAAYRASKYGTDTTDVKESKANASIGGERRNKTTPPDDDSRKKIALAVVTALGIAAAFL